MEGASSTHTLQGRDGGRRYAPPGLPCACRGRRSDRGDRTSPLQGLRLVPTRRCALVKRRFRRPTSPLLVLPRLGGDAGGSRSGGRVLRGLRGRWVPSCPRRMGFRYSARATPVGGGSRELEASIVFARSLKTHASISFVASLCACTRVRHWDETVCHGLHWQGPVAG